MGPRPKGNPGAIEETARALGQAADQLNTAVGSASLNLPGDALIGPARAGLDAGVAELRNATSAAVAVIRSEAAMLASEADTLRDEQKAWDRRAKETRDKENADREAKMCVAAGTR